MTRIYDAANGVEAHMVLHLLQQAGIPGQVQGEFLQGGVGELPGAGLVYVDVPAERADEAREIIREWESKAPPARPANEGNKGFRSLGFFIAGAMASGVGVWAVFSGPASDAGFDYNRDGVVDERTFYNGSRPTRVESDRNFDGNPDLIWEYSASGAAKLARIDDNFDGRFENITTYRRGQAHEVEIDRNGDGKPDYKAQLQYGVLVSEQYMDPESGAVVKQVTYAKGWPEKAMIDRDGDGTPESYEYDYYGDLVAASKKEPQSAP